MANRRAKAGGPKPVTTRGAVSQPRRAAKATTPTAETVASTVEQPSVEKTEQTTIEGTRTMTDKTSTFTADRFQAAFGDVNERAKVAVEKGTKLLEEATELTKGNVEAIVASSKIAAKGVETLGQDAAEFGRKSFEQASAALKSFAEVKSPTDFFRLQNDYAKSAFDSLVAESNKVSEAVIKLAGDVAQPLTNRYSVAAERVKSLAA
jgi:phasin family protein